MRAWRPMAEPTAKSDEDAPEMTTEAPADSTTELTPEETQDVAAATEAVLAEESDVAAEEEVEEFEGQSLAFPAERVPYLIEALLFVSDGPSDEGALARAL